MMDYGFIFDNSAYENLKTAGFYRIKNKDLRNLLSDYRPYQDAMLIWPHRLREHLYQKMFPYCIKQFKVFVKDNRAEPNNFKSLKQDKEFEMMLKTSRVLYFKTRQVYTETLPELIKFIEGIEKEVE